MAFSIQQAHVDEILNHAEREAPRECCGLIGGNSADTQTIYPLRNAAADPLVTYEAAPEDLFAAQRAMRDRGERLWLFIIPIPGREIQSRRQRMCGLPTIHQRFTLLLDWEIKSPVYGLSVFQSAKAPGNRPFTQSSLTPIAETETTRLS